MGQGGPVRAKGVGAQKKVDRFAHGWVSFNLFLFVIRFGFHEVGPGRLALAKPGYATLGAVPVWDEAWVGLP